MSEQKGFGSKLLGIFVEPDANAPAADSSDLQDSDKTPAELVAELAHQSAGGKSPAPRGRTPAATPEPLPSNLKFDRVQSAVTPGAPLDFNAIFRDAGMDAGELDRVKKAEDLLRGLPDSTPQPVKKQIVEASLKAFGFEIEKIVLAAQNQRRALDAYVRVNETSTAKALTDAELQIRTLTEKIASLRGDIDKRTQTLQQVSQAAQTRKTDVQKVIEFFQGAPPPAAPGPTQS